MSDTNLTDALLGDKSKRPAILDDCVRLIEDEVSRKSGVSGLAIKGGFKVVKKVKPGIIREAMDHLLDEFVSRFEPLWAEHMGTDGASADNFYQYLERNREKAADALLGVTDDRAKRAQNKVIKGAYERLRPQGKKHVAEAVPRAGKTLVRHI